MIKGDTFGRLTFIKMVDKKNAVTLCSCGNEKVCNRSHLKNGYVKSCGCLDRENKDSFKSINKTHGLSNTDEYRIWNNVVQRTTNPNHPRYKDYGGRGITICNEWRDDFMAFYTHLGPRPSVKHSIDRIENSKGYIPGNVRWVTDDVQANNKRNNTRYVYNGKSYTISELADKTDILYTTLQQRLLSGWDVIAAMETPVKEIPKYLYNGKMMNLAEISEASGIKFDAIRHRIGRKGMSVEDAIALGNPGAKLYTHDGVSLTSKDWATRLGMKVDTLRNKLGRQGYSISDVVRMVEGACKD